MHKLILLLLLIPNDNSLLIKEKPGFIVDNKFILKYECKSNSNDTSSFKVTLPEGKYYYLNKDKSDTIPFYVDENGYHRLK